MAKLTVIISNPMGAAAMKSATFETMEEAEQQATEMESQGFTAQIKLLEDKSQLLVRGYMPIFASNTA